MNHLCKGILLALALSLSTAHANGLFYDSCIETTSGERAEAGRLIYADYRGGIAGLTCEDLKSMRSAYESVSMALYPATLAIAVTPARDQILAELATLGLTMANPAVLGVTVIGAFGVITVYFVLKATMEECERMDQARLKEEIVNEMAARYGLDARKANLEMKRR